MHYYFSPFFFQKYFFTWTKLCLIERFLYSATGRFQDDSSAKIVVSLIFDRMLADPYTFSSSLQLAKLDTPSDLEMIFDLFVTHIVIDCCD